MKRSARTSTSLAAAAALLVPLAPLASAAPPSYTYDAIGDSYAAGSGAPEGAAYPEVLDGRMRITLEDFVAEPGATAGPGSNSLTDQLGALDDDTDLVTLTIGGNDIPWTATLLVCLGSDDATCLGAIAGVEAQIGTTLPGILDQAYEAVHEAAPNAHVVVTGYARLFSPRFGDYVPAELPQALMSVTEQEAANGAADKLNATIAERADAHGFEFVDITKRFDGHGANSANPYINPLMLADLGSSFHPNAKGYKTYGAALTSAINPNDLRG